MLEGREHILRKIQGLESKYPLDQWMVNGVHIWPLLRVQLLFCYYNTETQNASVNKTSENGDQGIFRKLGLALKGLWFLVKLQLGLMKSVDFLFFSYSSYVDPSLEKLDKFCLPIANSLSGTSKILQMRIGHRTPIPDSVVNLEPLMYILDILIYKGLTGNKEDEIELPGFQEFKEEVLSSAPKSAHRLLEMEFLTQRVRKIKVQSAFFQKLIAQLKPRLIFHICYYNSFAVNHAGRVKGIPVIDVQHGVQGPINGHYMGWTNIPQLGFNVMPTHYWCWTQQDAELINTTNHGVGDCAFEGGNPLFDLLKNRSSSKTFPYADQRCVLYTLQNRTEILPESLKNAINESVNTKWLFRLHPLQRPNKEQIIKEIVDCVDEQKVEFEIANSWSVIDLISVVDLHITGYSATIIEAAILGLNSIALHPSARKYFNDSPYQTSIFYYDEGTDLTELMEEALSSKNQLRMKTDLISEQELLKRIR